MVSEMADPQNDFEEAEIQAWFDEEESEVDKSTFSSDSAQTIAEKYARSQLRVVRETKDYTLDYLRHALRPGQELINVSPSYQRRLRWTRKKRSLLIESFLLNIPIPAIFLFESDYNEYEVIDGRQRLDAIREFLANNYALIGLEYWEELNGQRFNDLPSVLQKGLLRRSLSAVVLLAETRKAEEDDIDVRTVLFDRLNTGGEKLNPQELRNALYAGPFNSMLIRLARSTPFTTAWNIPPYQPNEEEEISPELANNTLYRTMADAELVLRFFAIRDAIQNNKRGSLRRVLDRYMKEHASDIPSQVEILEKEYLKLLESLVRTFDDKPFRLPTATRPSRPLYDALMVALSTHPDVDLVKDKQAIKARLDHALNNSSQYDILVGRGNTMDAIHDRVELAVAILTGKDGR
jgi:hypothetical protein